MPLLSLVYGMLLAGVLSFPTNAEQLLLPSEVVNVALPEFGDRIGAGSDYGLVNAEPVEVGPGVGRGQEIRIVRTSRDLSLSRRNETRFQIRLGEITSLYFWIETPPVYRQWHTSLTVLHIDGYQETIFSKNLQPGAINFVYVPPQALLEVRITSLNRSLQLSKRFIFTASPVRFALWPDFRPTPYQTGEGQ